MSTEKIDSLDYYLAPLEGITGYIYRKRLYEYFGGEIARYFTPFFAPHSKRKMKSKEVREILPENNPGFFLVPQILTDSTKDCLNFIRDMKAFGFDEVNLNAGCPSGTVTSKFRGSGMLTDTERLDHFLEEIFEQSYIKISVKTRIGFSDTEEWDEILKVYKKYPISELIIHPRTRNEMYGGFPHRELFKVATEQLDIPLVYNGDIWSVSDMEAFIKEYPNTERVMIGRGLIANPSLVREIKGGEKASKKELTEFLEILLNDYYELYEQEQPAVQKLKEIWSFMCREYKDREKDIKKLLKARELSEFRILQRNIVNG